MGEADAEWNVIYFYFSFYLDPVLKICLQVCQVLLLSSSVRTLNYFPSWVHLPGLLGTHLNLPGAKY